jgi:O-antigen ligase
MTALAPGTMAERRSSGPARQGVPLVIGIAVATVAVGALVSSAPILAVALVVGGIGAAVLARHPLAATGALIASFFFDEILSAGGLVTPGKLIGVLAFAAWLVDTIRNGRPILTVPQMWPIGLLIVWLVPSLAGVEDSGLGLVFASRYVMFAALFFLVVQVVEGQFRRALVLADTAVLAAAAAGAIGLGGFLWAGEFRASGPLGDPNDFGFLLASTVPVALWRRADWQGGTRWNPFSIATVLILGATMTTFSRGAILALAITGLWAVATGRVPLRKGLVAVVVIASLAGVGYLAQGDRVDESVRRKSVVAQENVDSRVDAWGVALDQFGSAPITGVGPGQFEVRYTDFAPPPAGTGIVITTHNAYLNVLAELGLPGLLAFLGYLALSWKSLRRPESDRIVDGFRSALAASFLVALIGAFFLTEQFFAPLWLFGALGAAELAGQPARERRRAARRVTASAVPG